MFKRSNGETRTVHMKPDAEKDKANFMDPDVIF